MSILSFRDAFADCRDVASDLRFQSGPMEPAPRLSIAIPTFRRPALLTETIESAVHQDTSIPYEIIVVDNDPSGKGLAQVMPYLQGLKNRQVKYYVNHENLGMFGNWNRCIELSTAPWSSILNDDDILYCKFASNIFGKIDDNPDIDGIVSRKAEFFRETGITLPNPQSPFTWIRSRIQGLRFDRKQLMKVTPEKMFFGNDLRNSLGFVFKKDAAIAVGGYKPEEFPAADYFFYLRFSMKYNLYWYHETLAAIGMGENESMKMDTLMQYMYQGAEVREALAGTVVPADWIKMHPALTAYSMAHMEKLWNVKFDWPLVETRLNIKLPRPSLNKIRLFRLMHGGY